MRVRLCKAKDVQVFNNVQLTTGSAILDALLEILRNVHDLTTKVLRGGPDAAARFNTFYKLL